uniref:Aldehyde dehydrogenase putative n=1 Tax=Albugo laibachii Nc14 TaxID=890382 RepID=F0WUJ9_9STRA|nr:aldehyde dehydrogenase putative [Albugo laibachii Nc14]|eukprot:CCA25080.1 aldehyde dehydrogenase putative [Albugo laibachii Nc14]
MMVYLSDQALCADTFPEENNAFRRITHDPIGVLYVIAAWNYPLLTVTNSIIPAVLAGNTVILKHSPRTPFCGEHFDWTFKEAGFPDHIVQHAFTEHNVAADIINHPEIASVSFTGSVNGGHAVRKANTEKFMDMTLELGGNDAGYVASDADVLRAAESLADGVCYNAGQSCCGVERIYVHSNHYQRFLEEVGKMFKSYVLDDPLSTSCTLGPMALASTPQFLKEQVDDALANGATLIAGDGPKSDSKGKGRFYSPTCLAECKNTMKIMREESFGPIVGIEKVSSDEEAIHKINDSKYGLTSSIFTVSRERAFQFGEAISCGTVYLNRCDAVDPLLPWSGQKYSGKGISLSKYGFARFTRLKAWNFSL